MGDAAGEERVALGRLLVHVGVERVAGEMREVLDVVERDGALFRLKRLADREIVVSDSGTDGAPRSIGAPFDQLPVIALQHRRRGLHRAALHVVREAADAAEFLAAAGAAGAAMHHLRHRRAVAGLLLAAVAIDDDEAAVEAWKCRR